jgi:glutamate synthase domain-containing protein 1
MCGIVGLSGQECLLRNRLGELMVPMLSGMTERGPDSAGLAVYTSRSSEEQPQAQLCTAASTRSIGRSAPGSCARSSAPTHEIAAHGNHAVLTTGRIRMQLVSRGSRTFPKVAVLSVGQSIDLYKDVGAPADIARALSIRRPARARTWSDTPAWPPNPRSRRRTRIRSPRAAISAWCTTARCRIRTWCASIGAARHRIRDGQRHRGRLPFLRVAAARGR